MDILYIDESGNTGVKDDKIQKIECLCGVQISDTKYRKCCSEIRSFLADWGLPVDFEIKGYDLFHGEGYWKDKESAERIKFCKELSKFIGKSGILGLNLVVTTKSGKKDPYMFCLKKIINKAAKTVSKRGSSNKQLLVILDRRRDISASIVKTCIEQRKELFKKYKKSCVFIDSGFESDSENCLLLQIADFVAYFFRKQQGLKRIKTLFQNADRSDRIRTIDEIVDGFKNKILLRIRLI